MHMNIGAKFHKCHVRDNEFVISQSFSWWFVKG